MERSTIFAVKTLPPARVKGCTPFFYKAAELKRFRSHPSAQQSPRDEHGKPEASITEELKELHGACLAHIPQPICRRLPRDHRPTKCEPIQICTDPITSEEQSSQQLHLHRRWPHNHNSLKITCSAMAPPHLSECQHGNGAQSRNHACTAPGGVFQGGRQFPP